MEVCKVYGLRHFYCSTFLTHNFFTELNKICNIKQLARLYAKNVYDSAELDQRY